MKPIVLTHGQWAVLQLRLKADYPPSTLLIREKTKTKLGFVVREHNFYDTTKGGMYRNKICLDFYDEPKRTMFLLKYSSYIGHQPECDELI